MIPRPFLLLIRGIPGSGKSSIAESLAEAIGGSDCKLIDPDTILFESEAYKQLERELVQQGVDKKFYPYRFLRQQAHRAIESGQVVVWNQAFTNLDGLQKTIKNLKSHAQDNNLEMPVLVVEVSVDPAVAKARIEERVKAGHHEVSDEKFQEFVGNYRSFADQTFATLQVDGADPIEVSVDTVLRTIKSTAQS